MIKAIIFDFDGVIHDTFSLAFDTQKKLIKNLTLEEYRALFDGNIYGNDKITAEITAQYFSLVEEVYPSLVLEHDIRRELEGLQAKYKLFIITSNKESVLSTYFHNNNALSIFTSILGLETHKSKVEKFKMIFEKYGLERDECIFVTDTLGDILEANKVGVRTIAVDFGFHERERLERGRPERIISDFKELLPIVENS